MASPQQEIILHNTDLSIGKVSGEIPRLPGVICHDIFARFGDMIRIRNHDGNAARPKFILHYIKKIWHDYLWILYNRNGFHFRVVL